MPDEGQRLRLSAHANVFAVAPAGKTRLVRHIEQPIELVQQFEKPWCWACCVAMAIGFYQPEKYAPRMARIVEFLKMQPDGSCAVAPPEASLDGERIHMMALAIVKLGKRKSTQVLSLSTSDLENTLVAGDVAILAVRVEDPDGYGGHVVVVSGIRQRPDCSDVEIRLHDPARPYPFWVPYEEIAPAVFAALIVHVKEQA